MNIHVQLSVAVNVKYWDRKPRTSTNTFSLCEDEYTIDAEGVIHDSSVLNIQYGRRSRRKKARSMRLMNVDAVEEAVTTALRAVFEPMRSSGPPLLSSLSLGDLPISIPASFTSSVTLSLPKI